MMNTFFPDYVSWSGQSYSRNICVFVCPLQINFISRPIIGQHRSLDQFPGLSLATLGLYITLWSLSVLSRLIKKGIRKRLLLQVRLWPDEYITLWIFSVSSPPRPDEEKKKKGCKSDSGQTWKKLTPWTPWGNFFYFYFFLFFLFFFIPAKFGNFSANLDPWMCKIDITSKMSSS